MSAPVLALLAMLLGQVPTTPAQQYPPVALPRTEQRVLRSSANGVAYKLYIARPDGYASSQRRYPVVYLLDADYSFAIARNIVEHLSERGHLEPAVVVGIAYDGPPAYRRNRTRDYTPWHVPTGGYGPDVQEVSGGGLLFRRFLAEELIPLIDREYRVTAERVLVGHSYGGLFATWIAVTNPRLFTGYVIVSPSLWYDDHRVFAEERRAAKRNRGISASLYFAVGSREVNGERDMVADLERFARTLEARKYPGLRLRWAIEDDETHNSIFPGALSDGLRFVLRGR